MHRRRLAVALFAVTVPSCKSEAPSPAAPFTVGASVPLAVAPGAAGALVTEVRAGAGYHVNADFPMSFVPQGSSDGVRFVASRFELRSGLEETPCADEPAEACTAKAAIPFTTAAPGPQRVAGVLSFSVCNPEQCLIEKQLVQVDIAVE
jgi:hypothetical protein